jgi:hypothetical protein
MKRTILILFATVMCMSAGAQRYHGHYGPERGRDHGRHHIECATNDQIQMTLEVLNNISFDDKKLDVAKLCVTLGHFCVDDLARVAGVFSFDENRLKFLSYAYDYCEDPQNYYSLKAVFSFQSNFDSLMESVHPGYKK